MKKYIQILVVFALVLAVIGIARANPAWAGKSTNPPQAAPQSGLDAVDLNAAQPMSIIVTGSGSYLIGGVCKFDANYIATDIKNQVDAEVPIANSQKVPFPGKGNLFYPGCHVVHYKADAIVDQAKAEDGSWKVCFGKRPDVAMTIYYYLDNPVGGSPVWAALPTTVEGAYSCAPALYTGVYMPAGEMILGPGGYEHHQRHSGQAPACWQCPAAALPACHHQVRHVWHGRDLHPGCLITRWKTSPTTCGRSTRLKTM